MPIGRAAQRGVITGVRPCAPSRVRAPAAAQSLSGSALAARTDDSGRTRPRERLVARCPGGFRGDADRMPLDLRWGERTILRRLGLGGGAGEEVVDGPGGGARVVLPREGVLEDGDAREHEVPARLSQLAV